MTRLPAIPGFTIRPIALNDAAAWAAYVCLPEVQRHTSFAPETVEEISKEISRTLAEYAATPIRFAIASESSRTLVATVGFHTISPLNGTAEIAYDVTPSLWGKGIATAACRAATLWGFQMRGWHRIQGTTVVPNLASQRVLERCDFRREGLLRNFRVVRGQPTDYLLYSVLPGELRGAT